MRNYVAIAPRGTCADRTRARRLLLAANGRRHRTGGVAHLRLRRDRQRRFNIHPERIFLAGVGCGGTMALRVAWNHPGRFAGVATFGGPMPTHDRPLRTRQRAAAAALFRGHRAATAATIRKRDVCRDLRLLHAAGCTVALRQYPCGDDLTTTMLADLDRWIMEFVCPQQA